MFGDIAPEIFDEWAYIEPKYDEAGMIIPHFQEFFAEKEIKYEDIKSRRYFGLDRVQIAPADTAVEEKLVW